RPMAIREKFPKAQLPRSHYFFSVGRGDSLRAVSPRPLTLWGIIALLPLSLLWGGGATLYLAFHDEMLGIYLTHQIEMRNAYEDRIAEARAELDRAETAEIRPHPAVAKVPVAALNAIEAVSRTGPSDSVIGAATRAFAPL